MSAVILITPVVVNWSVYSAAITASAAVMGLKILKEQILRDECSLEETATEKSIEIPLDNAKIIEQSMKRNESITVKGREITATFIKDPRGECKVVVTGKDLSHEEIEKRGRELVRKVNQEYARTLVKEELKKKGFNLIKEETAKDGTIRISVRKWN